ncbi:hypothetical protein CEUSTIGMA_g6868.t1 [Chlamydomonas eustigma]|uniref:Coiled-coil domain-containing protein 39 n=1 Tax=Chlamydomonas eustigma TaxID=1157962 RepID=A0A250X8N9_9CHLO|nr:hypothetical protein CEUSTIGMA_g6868.t1 [Chlamydomonas eustigma]|eukprot:GAX79427.1 hypothetical protein CEUSTIGMA_g6868.t1 [Chlamydomonas eustigma]
MAEAPERQNGQEVEEDDISHLPPFANDENKALDKAVRDLEKQLEQTESLLSENGDRIGIMNEHLSNVQQELKYTQSRVEAKTKEIETESHLQALAERETGRVTKDIAKLTAERVELQDKVTMLQNQIYKSTEKMDQFKLLMNWNQEEIEQWALAQRQKEEDNAALEKYRHQDAAKVKELMLNQEKASKAVVQRKEELEAEVMETQAAQIQLDKAAEDFRKLHAERQDLIRQWDEAMTAMTHRDAAIAAASELFAVKKMELRQRKVELDAQARFLEDESMNNKEVDARIAFYEREIAKQRDACLSESKRLEEFNNQVETIKSTLSKAATELAQRTAQSTQAKQDLDEKRQRLDASRKRYAVLKRKLESEFGELDSMEEKVAELEAMRKAEELRLKMTLKDNEGLKKEQFKRSQRLFELRTRERELISDISGGQGQNKNLAVRITQLDEQVVRQQELLYNVEFQLQQMERKVARAGGHRTEDETRLLNARIEKLTGILEGVNAEHGMLLEQVKHSEENLFKARKANISLKADKEKVVETTSTLRLENEMTGRQVKAAIDQKEKALVEHDVTKLEVKRVRDILAMHADEVFSLENRKFQLKMSMEERREEIVVHRDGLRTELKLLREDVHRITLELKERILKVEKLQNKYETINSKSRSIIDDDEPKSQAYYVIKAAQEREELQREGDALDAKIRKAEQEVTALETTMLQLVAANGNYGATFKKVDSLASVAERAALREKLDKSYDKLKFKRQEEASLVMDLQQVEARLVNLSAEHRGVTSSLDDMSRRRNEAMRQVEEQQDKLGRAQRQVAKLQGRTGEDSPQVKEADLAEMRDMTRAMLSELSALAAQIPGLSIAEKAEQLGLKLPPPGTGTPTYGSRSGSVVGSRPGSARSVGSGGAASVHSFGSVVRSGSRPGSSVRQ